MLKCAISGAKGVLGKKGEVLNLFELRFENFN